MYVVIDKIDNSGKKNKEMDMVILWQTEFWKPTSIRYLQVPMNAYM